MNLKSVTNESNLEDFLNTASLAGTEFTAEKENVTLVESVSVASARRDESNNVLDEEDEQLLTIPRRPKWTREMKKFKLIEAEKREFLEWRRRVALIQEKRNYMTTPFEKNLEFWRQIWRVVEKSNVLVQVVDARNPLLFYSKDLDKYAKEVDPAKQSLLLMNKSDFLTEKQRQAWSNYFRENDMCAFFFSAIAPEEDDEGDESTKTTAVPCEPNSPQILSVGKLAAALHSFAMQAVGNTYPEVGYVTVGLVGYPNVGKSSTVNALIKSKKVATSATPGKTKHFQTIFLDKQFCLCDCPGLVFPNFVSTKAELIINGILPIDEMTNHVPPVNIVASLFTRKYFESFYGIRLRECEDNLESEELLNALGYLRGFMTPRGLPDHPKTARLLLKDFVNGKLLFCKAPPATPQAEYHTLKLEERKHREMTPNEKRIVIQEMSQSEFDLQFFHSNNSAMHVKGIMRPMGQLTLQTTASLPPKKLNKNSKKDKLRRVYSHLDQ